MIQLLLSIVRKHLHVCAWCLVVLVACSDVSEVSAQRISTINERIGSVQTNAAYFLYSRPGALTHQIYVIGNVNPGIYEVEQGTSLTELFVLASGAPITPRNQYEKNRTTVRLYRLTSSGRELVCESLLEDLLTNNQPEVILGGGDVMAVEVERRLQFSWRDGLSIATAAAAVALAIERLVR